MMAITPPESSLYADGKIKSCGVKSSQDNRIIYFDFLKGIAIIMVVGIHTMPHVDGYKSLDDVITILVRLLLNCAVPIFLAVSGWMLANKPLESKQDIIEFYKRRLPRVYIPLIVWGLGWFTLSMWNEPDIWGAVKSLLLLLTGGFSVYYFVALIMQCYLITPLLTKYYNIGMILCAVLSTIAIIITSWLINVEGHSFKLLAYAGPVYLWVVFYMLGIWLRKHESNSYFNVGLTLAIIGYCMSIVETIWYMNLTGGGVGIKLSSFIFSYGMIIMLVSKQIANCFYSSRLIRIVAWIGEVSFGVYLMHMYCIMACRMVLGKMPWSALWIISLGLTLLLIGIAQSKLSSKFTYKYLGF